MVLILLNIYLDVVMAWHLFGWYVGTDLMMCGQGISRCDVICEANCRLGAHSSCLSFSAIFGKWTYFVQEFRLLKKDYTVDEIWTGSGSIWASTHSSLYLMHRLQRSNGNRFYAYQYYKCTVLLIKYNHCYHIFVSGQWKMTDITALKLTNST